MRYLEQNAIDRSCALAVIILVGFVAPAYYQGGRYSTAKAT